MSDYTPTTTFENKDDLTTGDPDKIILGEDLDVEFAAIQVAIATKYDSADLATQAQAEAGSSNAVLMTPLRVTQLLANAGGSGAGIVNDLIALTDPGADRILFWDESDNATEFLEVGTGLSISGNTLSSDDANIDHDALTNFVANEHINHTSVTLTAGVGLSGGGDISANRTFNLDINGLTDIGEAVDAANDQIPVYNASGTAVRKTTPAALATAAGVGNSGR